MDQSPEAIAVIERHQQGVLPCPHCGKTHIVRNGHSGGHSAKGERHGLLRKARKRGGQASQRSRAHELVPVLVARDRAGQSADFIVEVDDSKHATDKLRPLMAQDAIVCTEGDATMGAPRANSASSTMPSMCRPACVSTVPGMCRTSTPTSAA